MNIIQGDYHLVEDTPERLVFTLSRQQRVSLSVSFMLLGVVLMALAVVSLMREDASLPGFILFLAMGVVAFVAAWVGRNRWYDLEFNTLQRQVIQRRHFITRERVMAVLPFEQMSEIQLVQSSRDVAPIFQLRLMTNKRRVWAILPGYRDETAAHALRQKIADFTGLKIH